MANICIVAIIMTDEYIVRSGNKFNTPQGFNAIKDGIKPNTVSDTPNAEAKPSWLKVRVQNSLEYQSVKDIVKTNKLSTVCEESKCPNINECWSAGTATIMIMGSVCTRACRFCSVDTGNPKGWLDPEEPAASARAVELMNLKYIVITSVDRDDLPDGGAQHYADCVKAIKKSSPQTAVEVLTPDFQGSTDAIDLLLNSGISVFAQNVETVKRLTHPVRDPRASYEQTIKLLAYAKKTRPDILTKTSLMLGLGEIDEEIENCMDDLREAKVDIVTFGQYLRPTSNHLPVQRYVTPEQFEEYRQLGLKKGFLEVVSGPFVRSSYRAEQVLEKNNVGL
jgi:lipoyl synthase